MAKADLLVSLFKAGVKNNLRDFQQAAEYIIAEERLKNHNVLAERLSEIIRVSDTSVNAGRLLDNGLSDCISEISPQRKLNNLMLQESTRAIIHEIIEEQQRTELLKSYGLMPRHKIMLLGPPGNGKTVCAEAIARELMVPLLSVNYDGVIGKFLGETSIRLKKIFEYARQTKCVLFFDEFDAIGKERGDTHETGEIKRVVSGLLMQIDQLPCYTVVIVSSNHGNLLDSAVWRRFQVRINMPPPTKKLKEQFIAEYAEKIKFNFGMNISAIVEELKADSYAEIEEFCRDVLRHATLELCRDNAKKITKLKIKQWQERNKVNAIG
ncbi:MAG: ATP-binding protein [Proteobacteria bacterium]|nr:ATP-binding protein [Pseudomonadota bacterium]